MDMDSSTAQFHHQEIGSQTLESMLIPTKTQTEKKPKPSEQALKCPRCDSTNTKFCYYNNYSLSQPRYFCKSCRRYWTKGGTLRNVPVGGGCRKTTKRSSSKRSSHIDQPITRNPSPIPSYTSPLSCDSQVFQSGVQHLHAGLDDFRNPNTHVSGFLEAPLGFYYGMNGDHGVGQMGLEINGGISGLNQEMGLMGFEDIMISGGTTTSTAVATVKQEIGRSEDGEINGRSMWGFQWQNVMGGEGNIGSNWNGIGSASNWHGLLNTPLM